MRDLEELMRFAWKVWPHSHSVRATYLMLDRIARQGVPLPNGRVRPVPLHELHAVLDRVCDEAMRRLGIDIDGVVVNSVGAQVLAEQAPVETLDQAREFMRRPGFCKTPMFRELQAFVDRRGAYKKLVRWERGVVVSMAARHIPIVARSFLRKDHLQDAAYVRGETHLRQDDAPHVHGFAVDLVHVDLRETMPPLCWEMLHHIGKLYARRYRLRLVPPPADKPWHWEVQDWKALRDERTGPAGDLSQEYFGDRWVNTNRSPPGEREWLLEYYGIEPEVEPYKQPEDEGVEGEALA